MKKLSAKNNEQKNDFSASLRPFGTHNSRYLQGLRHILLRYRYGERQISANDKLTFLFYDKYLQR